MTKREKLNEQELDQVVGGVFQFFSNGTKCKVGGKVYNCLTTGQFQIITLMNNHPDAKEPELIQMAIDMGILWTN